VGVADMPPPAGALPSTGQARRLAERIAYYRRDGRLWHAVRYQARLRLENKLLLRFGPASFRRVRAVRLAHAAAHRRYSFVHDHRGPLHLVRSTELAVIMDTIDWYDDLRSGPNEVTLTDISSTHARLLMEPETRELAAALSEGLDTAERRPDDDRAP
jgi:hypothetical protein